MEKLDFNDIDFAEFRISSKMIFFGLYLIFHTLNWLFRNAYPCHIYSADEFSQQNMPSENVI